MFLPVNFTADIRSKDIQKVFTYDNTEILNLDISYPEITLKYNPIAQNRINLYYQQQVRRFYNYAKITLQNYAISSYQDAIKMGYPFRMYDAVMKYTVTMNERCVLSTYFDQYEYTGGAHGSTTRFSSSWELQTGRFLRMRDLFNPCENYRKLVLSQIIQQADEQMSQEEYFYFDDYRMLIGKYFNPESFYLTPTGIVVYFQQYEIGPYAIGIVEFHIPYETLGIMPPGC